MDELEKLYKSLVRDGYYTKDFESFQSQYSGDEEYRNKVYDVVSRDGLYTKSREEFFTKYSPELKKKEDTQLPSSSDGPSPSGEPESNEERERKLSEAQRIIQEKKDQVFGRKPPRTAVQTTGDRDRGSLFQNLMSEADPVRAQKQMLGVDREALGVDRKVRPATTDLGTLQYREARDQAVDINASEIVRELNNFSTEESYKIIDRMYDDLAEMDPEEVKKYHRNGEFDRIAYETAWVKENFGLLGTEDLDKASRRFFEASKPPERLQFKPPNMMPERPVVRSYGGNVPLKDYMMPESPVDSPNEGGDQYKDWSRISQIEVSLTNRTGVNVLDSYRGRNIPVSSVIPENKTGVAQFGPDPDKPIGERTKEENMVVPQDEEDRKVFDKIIHDYAQKKGIELGRVEAQFYDRSNMSMTAEHDYVQDMKITQEAFQDAKNQLHLEYQEQYDAIQGDTPAQTEAMRDDLTARFIKKEEYLDNMFSSYYRDVIFNVREDLPKYKERERDLELIEKRAEYGRNVRETFGVLPGGEMAFDVMMGMSDVGAGIVDNFKGLGQMTGIIEDDSASDRREAIIDEAFNRDIRNFTREATSTLGNLALIVGTANPLTGVAGRLGAGTKVAQRIGFGTSSYLNTAGSSYREAIDAGLDYEDAILVSQTMAMTSAGIEVMFPGEFVFGGSFKPLVGQYLKAVNEGVSKKEALKMMVNQFGKEVIGENVEETFALISDYGLKRMADATINSEYNPELAAEDFSKTAALTTVATGLFGGARNMNNFVNTNLVGIQLQYDAVQKYDDLVSEIDQMKEDGLMDDATAERSMQNLDRLKKSYDLVQDLDVGDYEKAILTTTNAERERLEDRKKELNLESELGKKAAADIDNNIQQIDDLQKKILDGQTVTEILGIKPSTEQPVDEDALEDKPDAVMGAVDSRVRFNEGIEKVNSGQTINENDLEDAISDAYDALDELSGIDSEDARIMESLIEDEIEKLESYENVTTTETRKVAEEKTVRTVKKTPRKTTPPREKDFVGKKAVYSDNKGGGGRGVISVVELFDGNEYYAIEQSDGQSVVLGRRDKAFSEGDVNLDKDGNPTSVTFSLPDGRQVTVKSPDVAMEVEIEQMKQGEYDEEIFEETYIEFVGTEEVEVRRAPVPTSSMSQKRSQDAIQERETEEVPVGERTEDSPEVEQEVREQATEEEVVQEEEPEVEEEKTYRVDAFIDRLKNWENSSDDFIKETMGAFNLPVAIAKQALTATRKALEAGKTIYEAMEIGSQKIREWARKNGVNEDEAVDRYKRAIKPIPEEMLSEEQKEARRRRAEGKIQVMRDDEIVEEDVPQTEETEIRGEDIPEDLPPVDSGQRPRQRAPRQGRGATSDLRGKQGKTYRVDSVIEGLKKFEEKQDDFIKGTLGAMNIPVAVVRGAATTIRKSLEAGKTLYQAMEDGSRKIREWAAKNNQDPEEAVTKFQSSMASAIGDLDKALSLEEESLRAEGRTEEADKIAETRKKRPTFRDAITSMMRERREAVKEGKAKAKELKNIKDEAVRLIKNAMRGVYQAPKEYKRSDVNKIMQGIRDAKTYDDVEKLLEQVQEIVYGSEKESKIKSIRKIIDPKRYQKIQGGKAKGKLFTAEDIRAITILNDAANMTKQEGAEAVAEIISRSEGRTEEQLDSQIAKESKQLPKEQRKAYIQGAYATFENTGFTPQELMEIDALRFAGLEGKTLKELQELETDLKEFTQSAREAKRTRDIRKHEELESDKDRWKEAAGRGEPEPTSMSEVEAAERNKNVISNVLDYLSPKTYLNSLEGLKGLLNEINRTKDKGLFDKDINEIRSARRNKESGLLRALKLVQDKRAELLGKGKNRWLNKASENLGVFDGKIIRKKRGVATPKKVKVDLNKMTPDELTMLWLQMQQEDSLEKLKNDNGFSDEAFEAVDNWMNDPKNSKLKEYAEWLMNDFFPSYYDRVNEVFMEVYGIPFPLSRNYVPMNVESGSAREGTTMGRVNSNGIGTLTGRVKNRVSNGNPIEYRSRKGRAAGLESTVYGYINDMEHFIAFEKVLRRLNRVAGDKDVRRVIVKHNGDLTYKMISSTLADLQRDSAERGKRWMNTILNIKNKMVVAKLALNLPSAFAQLMSFPAYAARTNSAAWAKEFAKTWSYGLGSKSVRDDIAFIANSDFLKSRMGRGYDRDVAAEMQREARTAFSGKSNLSDRLMFMTKYGDAGAILLGGVPMFRTKKAQYIEERMSKEAATEKAYNDFVNATSDAQQSSYVEDLSSLQRDRGAGNLLTTFMSSAIMYLQQTRDAIRNIRRGRADVNDVKRLIMFNWTLPLLYVISKGAFDIDDDEEDQAEAIKTILMSPASGMPFFGTMANNLYDNNAKEKFSGIFGIEAKNSDFSFAPAPVFEEMERSLKKIQDMSNRKTPPTNEDYFNAYIPAIELLTGMPVKNVKKVTYDNWKRYNGDMDYDNFLNYLGYSEYKTIGNAEQRNASRKAQGGGSGGGSNPTRRTRTRSANRNRTRVTVDRRTRRRTR